MDDQKLIDLALAGHSEAVGQLYDKYFASIYRFFYWQTNSQQQEAEDLTHDTFIEMVKSLKNFSSRSSFKNWLYAIAKNRLKHWLKHKYRFPTQPLFESISDLSHWIDPVDQENKIQSIQKILATLEPKDRKLITLRYLRHYSVNETAKALNLSPSNVKVLAHRIIKKLQTQVVTE